FAMAFGLAMEICHIQWAKKQSIKIKQLRPLKLDSLKLSSLKRKAPLLSTKSTAQ
ncbi:TerC family protein, partial [Vibrio anguillarum]|nr:TerC family protein [Vibrio anguillarum]